MPRRISWQKLSSCSSTATRALPNTGDASLSMSYPGILPNMSHPGILPNMSHPGILPNMSHPGILPNMSYPGTMLNMSHPGIMPNMSHPGILPNMSYPGTMPNMSYPGIMPNTGALPYSGTMSHHGAGSGPLHRVSLYKRRDVRKHSRWELHLFVHKSMDWTQLWHR